MILLDEQVITFDILNKLAAIILIIKKLIKILLFDFLIFQGHSLSHEMFMLHAFLICIIHDFHTFRTLHSILASHSILYTLYMVLRQSAKKETSANKGEHKDRIKRKMLI